MTIKFAIRKLDVLYYVYKQHYDNFYGIQYLTCEATPVDLHNGSY